MCIRKVFIPIENDRHLAAISRATKQVTIAPQSACIIMAKIRNSEYFPDLKNYSFKPSEVGFIKEQPEIKISPSLVKIKNRKFPVQLINTANKTIRIRKGCRVGDVIPIIENSSRNKHTMAIEITNNEFKEQIRVDNELREVIEVFLLKNKEAFAFSDNELQGTDLSVVEIDTGTHDPINIRPYRIPLGQRDLVSDKIDDLLEAGLICRSNSPWNFPIVIVEKKPDKPGGEPQKRMCVDFRALNQIVHIRSFPIPLIDDILANLKGTTFFTTLDMRSGYHQIPLSKHASDRCAFSCFKGKYQYKVLPYGLKNSGNEFQSMVNRLLKGHESHAMAYVDDILIFTKGSLKDHLMRVQDVLDRLKKHNLKLKLSKCQWAMKEITYLGFVVNQHGVAPCADKIKAIKTLQPPSNVRQTRGLLRCASYYRRFIPRFAELSEPLVALTRKFARFKWSDECQTAFEKIKQQLTVIPMLAYPDPNEDYILYTDASDMAIGSVLVQKTNGKEWIPGIPNEKPIYFVSHKLSKAQVKSYSTIEKEMFAIHYSLNKLHFYLYNAKFTIKTDHQPLKYLFTAEQKNRRVQSWAMNINSYNCTIEYISGRENVTADLLSRSPPDNESENENLEVEVNYGNSPYEVAVLNSNKFEPKDFMEVSPGDIQTVEENNEYGLMDEFDIKQEQEKDESIMDIKQKLTTNRNEAALFKKFILKKEVVYYITNVDDFPQLRLYVPKHLTNSVMKQYHDDNGHMGTRKVYLTIREKYYWPNLYKELHDKIEKCIICKQTNMQQLKAPVQLTNNPPYPMAVLQLDLSGPHRKTLAGNLYIATFICMYSGWIESFSIPDKSAQSVIECLLEYILPRHSCCLAIQTDNGSEFCNQYFEDILRKFNIKHIRSSVYSPRTCGQVERSHKSLNSVLSKLMKDHVDTWDLYLNSALMALRTHVSNTTMMSPFKILYNRDAVLPIDNLLMPREKTNSEDYHELAFQSIHKIFMDVVKNTRKAKKQRNKIANLKRKDQNFKVGDSVYLKNFRKSTKLDKSWLTHFVITEKNGPVSFKVRNQLTGNVTRVHADALRLANVTWRKPHFEGKQKRKTRLVASPLDSSSQSSDLSDEDVEVVRSPSRDVAQGNDSDVASTDSDKTIIYDPNNWVEHRNARERKVRPDSNSEDDIPEFELRKRTRKISSDEEIFDMDSDESMEL